MAQSTYDVSGKMDSVHLKYKKYSHSRFDLNMLLFQYNYPYRTTPMINFGGATTTPQVKADTMRHWSLDPFTLGFGLFESGYATYSSAGNLLTYKDAFEDTLTYQSFYYNNSFNANNQISKGNWFQIRGGHNDSMNRQFFHYNASNQLIVDSIQTYRGGVWKKSTLTKYTYSGGDLTQIHCFGNLSDSTFDSILPEQLSYINNYDVQHRLINVLTSNYDGHGMVQTVKDTFDYTDTLTYHSSWRQHVWDAINHHWTPWMKMTKNITSQGLPDSTFIYSWDSSGVRWLPHTLDVTHFNHYRDPDTLKDWEYSFGSFPTAVTYTSYY
jgi:hypothetical protein